MTDENYADQERRRSFRLDMEKELIELCWQSADMRTIVKKVACLDFARGGVKVDCDQEIAVDTQVTVTFKPLDSDKQTFIASVIRCLQQDNGWFHIALRLNDDVQQ